MFVFELKIKIPNEGLEEELLEKIEHFLIDNLYRDRQIIYRDVPIIKEKNVFICLINCVEIDSLNYENRKYYVSKYWEKIELISQNKIEINFLGKEYIEYTKCCGKQTFLILYSDSKYSPIRCGDCFDTIPIYSIPETYEDGKGYDDIFFWEKNYDACYDLWFSSEIDENFHLKQLSNVDSELTKLGLNVCKNIERVTGKKVYYYLMNYEKNNNVKCPSCNKEWTVTDEIHEKFNFKCDSCNLIA